MEPNTAIQTMSGCIAEILADCQPTIYLCGSCVLEDFRAGWSDIDILVLTRRRMSASQAETLVGLRQQLQTASGEPIYRSFEGGMLSLDGFLSHAPDTVVYWGTSGERITDRYPFDACSMQILHDHGRLLCGPDLRDRLPRPAYEELRDVVRHHYDTIRKFAVQTGRSLYSCGWLLDIARGVYTLRTGKVISKTAAGEWALKEGLFADPTELIRALEVRRDPLAHVDRPETFDFAERLGETVQRYADVLERELEGQKR